MSYESQQSQVNLSQPTENLSEISNKIWGVWFALVCCGPTTYQPLYVIQYKIFYKYHKYPISKHIFKITF